MNIKPDKILHKKVMYVCKLMRLRVMNRLSDRVGTYAYVLADEKNRRYLFACKRYIDWSPRSYGRVSFTKSLVRLAATNNWMLLMLIEEKDGDSTRDYIYTYNPTQILETGYDNIFNEQLMINFDIILALNMELTRRKEILEVRASFRKKTRPEQKDKIVMDLTRFF